MVKKINSNEFENAVSNGIAVVDFSATWCGPCKMLAPVLDEISEEFDGKINFFNVDCDENGDLAEKFGVMSIPAIVVLKDGEKQDMAVGFQPKQNLKEFFEKYV